MKMGNQSEGRKATTTMNSITSPAHAFSTMATCVTEDLDLEEKVKTRIWQPEASSERSCNGKVWTGRDYGLHT